MQKRSRGAGERSPHDAGASPLGASQPPCVVVYGAGAVGCYFGAKLAEAGVPVTLVGRPSHVEAIREAGLLFESAGTRRHVAIDATTDPEAVRGADVVLFSVKTRDTDAGAREIAARARPSTIVVSLQNGVDNVPRMREAGVDALGAVVYVACSMPAPGHLLHAGRGDLVIGEYASRGARPSARARAIAVLLERAGVPCRLADDVRDELWSKLVVNCAYNAISALARSRYGPMLDDADTRRLMRELIDECVAVARAEDVSIGDAQAQYESTLRVGEAMSQASSSMAQDLSRGRLTEIDSLNGYVARRGAALGIDTPVNRALATMIRLLEQHASRTQ